MILGLISTLRKTVGKIFSSLIPISLLSFAPPCNEIPLFLKMFAERDE